MSTTQHIVYGVGGIITFNVASLPTTATVTIKTGGGSTVVDAQTATISAISTTLSSAAAAGARTIALTSATGVASGTELLLASPPEVVRVKSITGTTATLWRPLVNAHASGVAATGNVISYTVLAASAVTLFFDGRAEWTLDAVLAGLTAVECTKYPLTRVGALDASDLFDEQPDLAQILSAEDDLEALLDEGFAEVLERIGAKARVYVYTGDAGFKRAAVFACMARLWRRRPGDAAQQLYDRYAGALVQAVGDLQGFVPRDENQDGVVTENERKSFNSGRIFRA